MTAAPDLHLFILWEHARTHEAEILADLEASFVVRDSWEIAWSPEEFAHNLTRFYGTLLPAGSGKEEHVGTGAFRLVIVEDPSPAYGFVSTTNGVLLANTNVFAAKGRYRAITGGGHKVHATNSPREFEHDHTLIFGCNTEDYLAGSRPSFAPDVSTSPVSIDVTGAKGWASLHHLFYVLNATIDYVVMRNFDVLPDSFYSGVHGDIDLLVADLDTAVMIANVTFVYPEEEKRVHVRGTVAGEEVLFDFRHVGDDYYDRAWQQDILSTSSLHNDLVRVPEPVHHFYTLLYHALIHKRAIAEDYVERFATLAPGLIVNDEGTVDIEGSSELLGAWLAQRSYAVTVPEPSVHFNTSHAGLVQPTLWADRDPGEPTPSGGDRRALEAASIRADLYRKESESLTAQVAVLEEHAANLTIERDHFRDHARELESAVRRPARTLAVAMLRKIGVRRR